MPLQLYERINAGSPNARIDADVIFTIGTGDPTSTDIYVGEQRLYLDKGDGSLHYHTGVSGSSWHQIGTYIPLLYADIPDAAATLADDDRVYLTDMSVTGSPNRYTTVKTLRAFILRELHNAGEGDILAAVDLDHIPLNTWSRYDSGASDAPSGNPGIVALIGETGDLDAVAIDADTGLPYYADITTEYGSWGTPTTPTIATHNFAQATVDTVVSFTASNQGWPANTAGIGYRTVIGSDTYGGCITLTSANDVLAYERDNSGTWTRVDLYIANTPQVAYQWASIPAGSIRIIWDKLNKLPLPNTDDITDDYPLLGTRSASSEQIWYFQNTGSRYVQTPGATIRTTSRPAQDISSWTALSKTDLADSAAVDAAADLSADVAVGEARRYTASASHKPSAHAGMVWRTSDDVQLALDEQHTLYRNARIWTSTHSAYQQQANPPTAPADVDGDFDNGGPWWIDASATFGTHPGTGTQDYMMVQFGGGRWTYQIAWRWTGSGWEFNGRDKSGVSNGAPSFGSVAWGYPGLYNLSLYFQRTDLDSHENAEAGGFTADVTGEPAAQTGLVGLYYRSQNAAGTAGTVRYGFARSDGTMDTYTRTYTSAQRFIDSGWQHAPAVPSATDLDKIGDELNGAPVHFLSDATNRPWDEAGAVFQTRDGTGPGSRFQRAFSIESRQEGTRETSASNGAWGAAVAGIPSQLTQMSSGSTLTMPDGPVVITDVSEVTGFNSGGVTHSSEPLLVYSITTAEHARTQYLLTGTTIYGRTITGGTASAWTSMAGQTLLLPRANDANTVASGGINAYSYAESNESNSNYPTFSSTGQAFITWLEQDAADRFAFTQYIFVIWVSGNTLTAQHYTRSVTEAWGAWGTADDATATHAAVNNSQSYHVQGNSGWNTSHDFIMETLTFTPKAGQKYLIEAHANMRSASNSGVRTKLYDETLADADLTTDNGLVNGFLTGDEYGTVAVAYVFTAPATPAEKTYKLAGCFQGSGNVNSQERAWITATPID